MVTITATPNLEGLFVDYSITGLTPAIQYDIHRLQRRFVGNDDTGAPQYDLEKPDRVQLWSAVGHRVLWSPDSASVSFRDYEAPLRPHSLYIVETSKKSAYEWDYETDGDYDITLGTLCSTIVHFNRQLLEQRKGAVYVRSTQELGLYVDCCVYDMSVLYQARVTEMPVVGKPYATVVSDTREARRGTLVLATVDLGQYYDLRRIVFPATGRIKPVVFNAGGDSTLLLDDMTAIPLNVDVEQATQADADKRFVHIDYVETNRAEPLVKREGDNDDLFTTPRADFTISNTNPRVGQYVTLTNTSTGSPTVWDWTFSAGSTNAMGKSSDPGPIKIAWRKKGRQSIKLRVSSETSGAAPITKYLTVRA